MPASFFNLPKPSRHDGGHFRLYDPAHDPAPIYEGSAIPKGKPAIEDETEPECSTEFAYEADLRNYLAKNLSIIEPGLKLYQDEGITGIDKADSRAPKEAIQRFFTQCPVQTKFSGRAASIYVSLFR